MNENSISNFRIVICLVVWDEGWFFFPLLSFPSKTLSFWYGSYQSTRLEPPCICGLLCFTLRSQPWALSFLKYTKVHTTWYFMNNSILLPFFSMVVGFSTYVMTSDFSLFFMSHWNIERSKSFVLSRRKKNCMTQQQPHIVLTILTPFFVFPHNSILLFHIKKTFWKGKLFYNFKWHICSFVTQKMWVMVNFN